MKILNYYEIKNELNPAKVGKDFSQIGFMKPSGQFLNSWEFPKDNLEFQLELNDNSILTDFLNTSAVMAAGFFISRKARKVFEAYNLMNQKYYPSKVKMEGDVHDFFWMHLRDERIVELIDYAKSEFFETKFNRKIAPIDIRNFEDYEQKKEERGFKFGVKLEKIVFQAKDWCDLDLFTILPFDNKIYMSEKLKDALNMECISGYRIGEKVSISIG